MNYLKEIFIVAVISIIADIVQSATTNPVLSSWIKCTGKTKTYSGKTWYTDITSISYSSNYAYVQGQGLPNYNIGPWAANPNTPSGQNFTYIFPLSPTNATGTQSSILLSLGQQGAWSNGMALYGPFDGYTYNNVWHRNALYWEGISFDQCYGHPDGSGVYHNHVIPTCIYNLNNSAAHSPIVGFAFDGFPIYGPYGYSSAYNANSAIKLMVSGYALRSITKRDTINGVTQSAANTGPDVNTTYPLGSFIEDYEWKTGTGDLDANNGRWCVTPEYPSGTYAYFTTSNSTYYPLFPFVLGAVYQGVSVSPNGKNVNLPSGLTSYFSYSSSSVIEPGKMFFFISLIITIIKLNH